ncbi:MAG: hypothetical protein HOE90_14850 [Bacteriovoracaceae bacterium]|jgi:ATP-dependent DNA helicase DinG|nr:hypothetical protein [Bacteriovoracaceae bacterium]
MEKFSKLGKWAAIDIETTGINPSLDDIIDIGFLEFEGTTLIRKYSSLVNYEYGLSEFIQKLTGITSKMVKSAPHWSTIEPELTSLAGMTLLAHNAGFEQSFLGKYFDSVSHNLSEGEKTQYADSIYYLSLLFPERDSLGLDSFIQDFGIRDSEVHRGFEDSLDLIKVMLMATKISYADPQRRMTLSQLIKNYHLSNNWLFSFFDLDLEEIDELACQLDFDIESAVDKYFDKNCETNKLPEGPRLLPKEFSGKALEGFFKDEQKLGEVMPGYLFRDVQLNLGLKVGQSFKNHVHSLIQAPTGTGKTLGYLVPAVLFSEETGEQVLIATGTKALQTQAMEKDIPALQNIMGVDSQKLDIVKLVGSSNHFCESLFRRSVDEDLLFDYGDDFIPNFFKVYFDLLFYDNSRGGSRSRESVPGFLKRDPIYAESEKKYAVDYRACVGSKCPFAGTCSYINGLRKAKEADIIVGNHSMMFTWPRGLARPSYVVVDEAHKLEKEATSSFSHILDQRGMESLQRSLTNFTGIGAFFYLISELGTGSQKETEEIEWIKKESSSTAEMLEEHLAPLSDLMERYFKKMPRYSSMYWNELPMLTKNGANDQLGRSIFNHLSSIYHIVSGYFEYIFPRYQKLKDSGVSGDDNLLAFTRFESFIIGLEDVVKCLEICLEGSGEYGHSIKFHEQNGYQLEAAPIDVGKIIHENLLEPSNSVIFTSATLGNAHGDYGSTGAEWMTGYTYLDPEKRFKSGFYLPATFDYKNNARVFLCDDTPSLYDSAFVGTTLTPVVKLIKKLKGKSLLLFSAKTRFEKARELLLKELKGEVEVYIQGMGKNVVEEFKNSKAGVLLGMESFGEGIDVPGEALQFVFIDKIPDLRQDLVIGKRRDFFERSFGNEFQDYFMAHRARGLHQKLGRLIRSGSDFGGAIIVDSRIKRWKKRTKDSFLKLMEPYQIELNQLDKSCEGVFDFIADKGKS